MTRARSALVILVVAVSSASCGLANGLSNGDVRSPFFVLTDPGEGEGEGELEGCDADPAACWADGLLCNSETGECDDPDDVAGWCDAAVQLLRREDRGPLVELGGPVTLVDGCFVARLEVHDLERDVATTSGALTVQYVVPGSPALFAEVTGVEEGDAADIQELFVDVEACVSTTNDTEMAFNLLDDERNRSNAACGEIPSG